MFKHATIKSNCTDLKLLAQAHSIQAYENSYLRNSLGWVQSSKPWIYTFFYHVFTKPWFCLHLSINKLAVAPYKETIPSISNYYRSFWIFQILVFDIQLDIYFVQILVKIMYIEKLKRHIIWNRGSTTMDAGMYTHVTKIHWPCGSELSYNLRPVKSSNSTTPKLQTSVFLLYFPVIMHLKIQRRKQHIRRMHIIFQTQALT